MLLIDAYNVLWLGNASEPHGPDLSVSGLLRIVAHSRYRKWAIRLVCDGHPPRGEGIPSPTFGENAFILRLGPGEIVYAGHSGSADDVIERIIAGHASARALLVVSSDRRVKRAAGRRRARTIASEVFLAQVLNDRTRAPMPPLPAFVEEIPLGAHAIDLWRREFGLPPESDRALVEGLAPPPLNVASLNTVSMPRQSTRAHESTAHVPRASKPTERASPPQLSPTPHSQTKRLKDDPLLRDLIQEWGLTIDLDDLDTGRWLERDPGSRNPNAR